ncbi:MotA/TolQ/ExbB proton channel family protein [Carboxylicivirga sediminis]|uniref:MotA/TolQ/ExbB proton channel family protein n=1 Tax=Carboxylicivirga sediminis TaxID=2006564 RepID=A0A941F7Z3_9BACT|nr:MotA/TolQ/ExbB proton channel family protein [Carboxylicivirga sediminis]MBR8537458.1 MotA/TolQ/ExbB proton channel family protein [Carboxylicivirga sediminis]
MFDFLIQGGIYGMSIITLLGIAALAMAVYNFSRQAARKETSPKLLNSVLYLGSMSFFAGLVWNAMGLYQILDVIQQMGEVSQTALAGGLKAASVSTIWGLFLLFISYVCWFILRLRITE